MLHSLHCKNNTNFCVMPKGRRRPVTLKYVIGGFVLAFEGWGRRLPGSCRSRWILGANLWRGKRKGSGTCIAPIVSISTTKRSDVDHTSANTQHLGKAKEGKKKRVHEWVEFNGPPDTNAQHRSSFRRRKGNVKGQIHLLLTATLTFDVPHFQLSTIDSRAFPVAAAWSILPDNFATYSFNESTRCGTSWKSFSVPAIVLFLALGFHYLGHVKKLLNDDWLIREVSWEDRRQ